MGMSSIVALHSRVIEVLTIPGQMALTLILSLACSQAALLVMPITACLEPSYAAIMGPPLSSRSTRQPLSPLGPGRLENSRESVDTGDIHNLASGTVGGNFLFEHLTKNMLHHEIATFDVHGED